MEVFTTPATAPQSGTPSTDKGEPKTETMETDTQVIGGLFFMEFCLLYFDKETK